MWCECLCVIAFSRTHWYRKHPRIMYRGRCNHTKLRLPRFVKQQRLHHTCTSTSVNAWLLCRQRNRSCMPSCANGCNLGFRLTASKVIKGCPRSPPAPPPPHTLTTLTAPTTLGTGHTVPTAHTTRARPPAPPPPWSSAPHADLSLSLSAELSTFFFFFSSLLI